MNRFWRQWNFSLILLVAYLGTFHLWLRLNPSGVMASGLLMATVLSGLLWQASLRGYFANKIDLGIHASVILDIALEATIIPMHEGLTFYVCAAGFAVIIGAYRAWCLRSPAPLAGA
ncbi:MAG TPA: hypothetical protein VGH19_13605 [Verrucomicrobiae bacterium]